MILLVTIISFSLLAIYAMLMVFYILGWYRTPRFNQLIKAPKTTVSIIVPARNESENIVACIEALLEQRYSKSLFEIIVVDDNSQDNTLQLAQSFNEPNLKVLSLGRQDSNSFKKQAIELGVKNSKSDLIITTDADCIMNNQWLLSIASFYEQFKPKVISGPVTFRGEDNWLEKWQALDLIGLMGITAGAITNGFPNMCNGANLAYERKAFLEANGFEGIDRLPTGDDIFLMLKINAKYPGEVKFLKSQDAIVYTKPQSNLSQLFLQRMRWVSKSTSYQDKKISLVLFLAYAFNGFIIFAFLAGLFYPSLFSIAIVLLLIKSLLELPLLIQASKFFNKQHLLIYFIPAQLMHIIYVVLIGLISKIFPYTWKGRRYEPRFSS